MARTFLEMLAPVLQTPKRFFFACKIVANAEKFFVGLATLLQTPKSFSWLLQRSCKSISMEEA